MKFVIRETSFGWSLVCLWRDDMEKPEYSETPKPVEGRLADRMITTKIYVHSDKDYMREVGTRLGLTGEALDMFQHAANEVELLMHIDQRNGTAEIVAVNGRAFR